MVARSAAPGSSPLICKHVAKIIFPDQLLATCQTAKCPWPGRIQPGVEKSKILTDDTEVEKPGDVWAPFHLQKRRRKGSGFPKKGFFTPIFSPAGTHKVHPVFSQPVEALEEEEEGEKGNEARAEVVPEDGKGQAGLRHGVPRPLQ